MDFNGLNRCFFQPIGPIKPIRLIGRQNLLTCWLVGLLACRPVDFRCGYSDMKESLKPRK